MHKGDLVTELTGSRDVSLLDSVPRDVMALILGKCLADPSLLVEPPAASAPAPKVDPPVGTAKFSLFKTRAPATAANAKIQVDTLTQQRLEKELRIMVAVNKRVAALASVCRAFARAAATEEVARQALLAARQRVPERVWYGAKMSDAFRAQYRVLLEHVREEKLQTDFRKLPSLMRSACSMAGPPPPERGPHPADPPSFATFAGLNWEELQRVQQRSKSLLDFLHAFRSFSVVISVETVLLRYRMFLKLQLTHPNVLLLPTGDILFAQMAHIFRTADYHADVASGAAVLARDPLCLSREEELLYNEASIATAHLWEATFGQPYLASGAVKQHAFFIHQTETSSKMRKWDNARYVPPPSYISAVGPIPTNGLAADLPEIRLTAADIQNDFKWTQELDSSFRKMRQQASKKLSMYDVTDERIIQHLSTCYQRFLFLCKTRPDLGRDLAPPVAIDLLWHAHQATPQLYEEETMRICGYRVSHQPWPEGNSELRPTSDAIKCAWKTAFDTEMEEDHWYTAPIALSGPPRARNLNPL